MHSQKLWRFSKSRLIWIDIRSIYITFSQNLTGCYTRKGVKPSGFWLFTSHPPASPCLPFPSSNDDGMGYNHVIITCFWAWLHPTDSGKGRISQIHTIQCCFQGNRQAALESAAVRVGKLLSIPHAGCRQPWSHQWRLLSCDAPVSICLCPLIRDLIYSQLSPACPQSGIQPAMLV